MEERFLETSEALVNAQRDHALAKVRALAGPESAPGFDGTHCVSCGDPIEGPRLTLGKVRCIECQRMKEQGR